MIREWRQVEKDGTQRTSRIAAATVLYRPEADMLGALLAPLKADGLPLFLFVNGEVDEAVETQLAQLRNVSIERSSTNVGLGAGLNAVMEAAARAGFTHVLLFDQDSTPPRGLGETLLSRFLASGHPVAAVGPLLVPPEEEGYRPLWYSHRSGLPGAVDFLPTSGSLVAVSAWQTVGPFRADYFIDGIDVEWGFRAWSHGFASLLADDIRMAHRWGSAQANGNAPQILRQSDLRTYYYVRNTVNGLRLPHVPWRWRTKTAMRVTAQVAFLVIGRRDRMRIWSVCRLAVRNGWAGRMQEPFCEDDVWIAPDQSRP